MEPWTRRNPAHAGLFYALSPANDQWEVVHWSPDGEGGGALTMIGQHWEDAHVVDPGLSEWLWAGEVPQPELPNQDQYDRLMAITDAGCHTDLAEAVAKVPAPRLARRHDG